MSDVGGIERKAATTTKPDTGISVIVGFDAAGKQHRVLSSVTQVVNFYFDGRLDDRKTQVAGQLYMQFFFGIEVDIPSGEYLESVMLYFAPLTISGIVDRESGDHSQTAETQVPAQHPQQAMPVRSQKQVQYVGGKQPVILPDIA